MQDENSQIRLGISDILTEWQPVASKWQEVALKYIFYWSYTKRAQVVGKEGADKRIELFAQVIKKGGTDSCCNRNPKAFSGLFVLKAV